MARYLKTKKEHLGLSPYEIYFKGEQKSEGVSLEVIDYDSENLDEFEYECLNSLWHLNDRLVA